MELGRDYIWCDLGISNQQYLLNQVELSDGVTASDTKGSIDCRNLRYNLFTPNHNHMYFKVHDTFMYGGNVPMWIAMEYWDQGVYTIDCQYDSNNPGYFSDAFRGSLDGAFPVLTLTNTSAWLWHVWPITDAKFGNNQFGADFRFSTHLNEGGVWVSGDIWINRVIVSRIELETSFDYENFAAITFTDSDTTPSVFGIDRCYTGNSGPTTITQFDNGMSGQTITIMFFDSNTTIQDGVNIALQGSLDFIGSLGDMIQFELRNGLWLETSRTLH